MRLSPQQTNRDCAPVFMVGCWLIACALAAAYWLVGAG